MSDVTISLFAGLFGLVRNSYPLPDPPFLKFCWEWCAFGNKYALDQKIAFLLPESVPPLQQPADVFCRTWRL